MVLFETSHFYARELSSNEVKKLLKDADDFKYAWAIVTKKDHEFVEFAILRKLILNNEECYELICPFISSDKNFQSAVEIAQAIKKFAFTQLSLNRLVCFMQPNNSFFKSIVKKIRMFWVKTIQLKNCEVEIYAVDRIIVSAYREEWKEMFQKEVESLSQMFSRLITFHHIGSTSIPYCSAKPIIDILGVTNDVLEIDHFNATFEQLGYACLGEFGMKQRRFFKKTNVNLHIFEDSDPEVARHLRFRDFMRAHPYEVEKYSELKKQNAKEDPSDIENYILKKESFIKKIDYKAAIEDCGLYWNQTIFPRKTTWTQDEILNAMAVNMQLQMTYFSKYLQEMQLVYAPDITIVKSSIRGDTFNFVADAKFDKKDVSKRIKSIEKLYQTLPMSWWVGETDLPENLKQELVNYGFVLKEEYTGMYLQLDDTPLLSKARKLIIQRILEKNAIKDFVQVLASIYSSYNLYNEFFHKIPPILYAEGAPYEIYVGYFKKVAVTIAILVMHANVGGIYYLLTHPDHRKKGYAKEMMFHLLMRIKKRGYHLSTLLAPLSGRNLYFRLGFQPLCQFTELGLSSRI